VILRTEPDGTIPATMCPLGAVIAPQGPDATVPPMPLRRSTLVVVAAEAVAEAIDGFLSRLEGLDEATRAWLPAERTIVAHCTDARLRRVVRWRDGTIEDLDETEVRLVDITVTADSSTILGLADGTLAFADAYLTRRLRIDASITDLLLLRAAL